MPFIAGHCHYSILGENERDSFADQSEEGKSLDTYVRYVIDEDFFQLFAILVEDSERCTTAIDEASREDAVDISHDELSIQRGPLGHVLPR